MPALAPGDATSPPSRTLTSYAAGVAAGLALDAAIGDPRRGHPVAAFGVAAGHAERLLWRDSRTAGVAYTLVCVSVPVVAATVAARLVRRAPVVVRASLLAAASWAVVGGTTLGREAASIAEALDAGDLALARQRLPALVGRDPSALDAAEIARAVVESVAENTSDAVVAPLFWGAVAGVPGLVGYRAINTLDAMVGHRSARYRSFGWASARLDDLVNWPPARLTGWLTVGLAPAVGGSRGEAAAVLRRDGARHPSPNAGRCEAAFAGALGLTLGGRNDYGGRVEQRPSMGAGRVVEVDDVARAVRLSRRVSLSSALLCVVAGVALRRTRAALAVRTVGLG